MISAKEARVISGVVRSTVNSTLEECDRRIREEAAAGNTRVVIHSQAFQDGSSSQKSWGQELKSIVDTCEKAGYTVAISKNRMTLSWGDEDKKET